MYKLIISMWIILCGMAASYSVVVEREKKLSCLRDLIHIIEEMEHEIIRWNMPIEEILLHMDGKPEDRFQNFFHTVLYEIQLKQSESLHDIWSGQVLEIKDFILLPDTIKKTFSELFLASSIDSSEQGKHLEKRRVYLQKELDELEEKYKQEHKLVLTLGFFISAFISLMLM